MNRWTLSSSGWRFLGRKHEPVNKKVASEKLSVYSLSREYVVVKAALRLISFIDQHSNRSNFTSEIMEGGSNIIKFRFSFLLQEPLQIAKDCPPQHIIELVNSTIQECIIGCKPLL